MRRDDQFGLLTWVLGALPADGTAEPVSSLTDRDLPAISVERFAAAGVATGLTCLVGLLAEQRAVALPAGWGELIAEQRATVRQRQERYRTLSASLLTALSESSITAVQVKGLAVAALAWPSADVRPMADIDLMVSAADRVGVGEVLTQCGLRQVGSEAHEDVYLAWGDGCRGALGRESIEHNGKVEVHAGVNEVLHGYSVTDGEALLRECRRAAPTSGATMIAPPPVLAAHAVAHLSASVIRCEVRALNIVDVVLLVRALGDADRAELAVFCRALDPRLSAPGWWAVHEALRVAHTASSIVHSTSASVAHWFQVMAETELARLPRRAAHTLRAASTEDVLRLPGSRTTLRWRMAFAMTGAERIAVTRQAILPSRAVLTHDEPEVSMWRLHLRRVTRAVARLWRRLRRAADRARGSG